MNELIRIDGQGAEVLKHFPHQTLTRTDWAGESDQVWLCPKRKRIHPYVILASAFRAVKLFRRA
jgi:hypothetical protein